MEIKTLDDAKKEMMDGNSIRFMLTENKPENLEKIDILEGKIIKINSQWEHTKDGDVCVGFQCQVDVVDPIDGGLHHLKAERAYTLDTTDADINFAPINDEIARLQKQIQDLEAMKV